MLGYITLIANFSFSFIFFGFLAQLLDAECILPLVVAISGRVGSETPITCELSGLRGVVVEETVILQTKSYASFIPKIYLYFFPLDMLHLGLQFDDYVTFFFISSLGRTAFSETQRCRFLDTRLCFDAIHE